MEGGSHVSHHRNMHPLVDDMIVQAFIPFTPHTYTSICLSDDWIYRVALIIVVQELRECLILTFM